MTNQQTFTVRDLRNGDWYWIHKAVIQKYMQKVGAVGIAVYNLLASMADSDQGCFPSQKYIAKCLGYSRSYINETLKALERNGLIRIEKKGRYHLIYHLLRLSCGPERTQVSTIPNSGVDHSDTNDNKRSRSINNIDVENESFLNQKAFKGFRPRTREELLALDLAEALDDVKGLRLYLSYAKKYPASLLWKVLGEVKEIPEERIRKSRAALFNHMVRKHAEKATKSNRD